jgi:caspase domain-containing protein
MMTFDEDEPALVGIPRKATASNGPCPSMMTRLPSERPGDRSMDAFLFGFHECRRRMKWPPGLSRWIRAALSGIAASWLLAGAGLAAETRVALVIGNGTYRTLPRLANPPNDAQDIAVKLRKLGFKVMTGVDLDKAGMKRKIAAFAKEAGSADVSLFYYGGHGVQVAAHNFLLPVDFEMRKDDDVYTRTVAVDEILDVQQGGGVHLVFLDACRTNPVKDSAAVAYPAGLAQVGNAAGFLIAFATQPDGVTYDGRGRNSPFAAALLNHLAISGQPVSSMMIDVRREVIAMTEGVQIPWENSSLTRQFYFVPGSEGAEPTERPSWQLLPISFDAGGTTAAAAPAPAPSGKKGHHGSGH